MEGQFPKVTGTKDHEFEVGYIIYDAKSNRGELYKQVNSSSIKGRNSAAINVLFLFVKSTFI